MAWDPQGGLPQHHRLLAAPLEDSLTPLVKRPKHLLLNRFTTDTIGGKVLALKGFGSFLIIVTITTVVPLRGLLWDDERFVHV